MAVPPKDCFTFTWKIENFSMCPQKQREFISSPIFPVESLHKSSWQLRLFPKGEREAGYMSCFLKSETVDTSEDLNIYFMISLVSINPKKKNSRFLQATFKGNQSLGLIDFVSLEVFDKDAFLPNDTLTVTCNLWDPQVNKQAFEPNNSSILTEKNAEIYHNFKGQFSTTQCSILTGIRISKKSVFWPIENFSALRLNQKLSLYVVSVLNHQLFLTLNFYLTGECVDGICGNIEIQKDKNFSEQVFVKCHVSVPDESEKYNVKDEHLFESNAENDTWKLPTFIQYSTLLEDKYLDTTGDVLHLLFQFTYSRLEDTYHAGSDEILPSSCYSTWPCKTYNPFQSEFKNLYKEGKFSDLTLLAGKKEFKVHKNILSTRSSVFSAMFESDMKEKQTGVVDITDLEADTVDLMLSFMYSNILEDIKVKEALKLYSAADKYAVMPLKYRCRCILKNSIDLSHLCDILGLADLHQDKDLLDAIYDFIRANSGIFLSQEWESLITSNSLLAARVMHKMLI